MSYDVALVVTSIEGDKWWVFDQNHTSNTAPMWRAAGCDIAAFHGRDACDLYVAVRAAIRVLEASPDTYQAMNPPNGWGSYETCLEFLRDIRKGCATFPNARVEVSH